MALSLFFAAIVTLLYVDNTIKINALLAKIQKQENQIYEIRTNNQLLASKIIELEAAERISSIAEQKLGMKKPDKVPILIDAEK